MSEADFSQIKKFFKQFEDAQRDFERFLKQFLLNMAQRAIADIKRNTPVDTGALRNMWGIGSQEIVLRAAKGDKVEIDPEKSSILSVDVVGDMLEVVIWNGMDYASFVEYGHRNWRTNNWVDGRFMMTLGIDKIQKQIPLRFEKEFKAFLTSKGAT